MSKNTNIKLQFERSDNNLIDEASEYKLLKIVGAVSVTTCTKSPGKSTMLKAGDRCSEAQVAALCDHRDKEVTVVARKD